MNKYDAAEMIKKELGDDVEENHVHQFILVMQLRWIYFDYQMVSDHLKKNHLRNHLHLKILMNNSITFVQMLAPYEASIS